VSLTPWGLVLGVDTDCGLVGHVVAGGSKLVVRASAPSGWCLYAEVAASGTMVGNRFMRRICCSHGLGDNLCVPSAARSSARSTRPREGGLAFRTRWWPQMVVRWLWSTTGLPFAA
jgi:hypothetical protein